MQDRVQNYAKAAKDLFSSVAKLAVTQATEQFASHQLAQTSTSPSAWASSVPLESRVSRLKQQLLASRIDLHELRRLSMQGIPDKDGLRAITWKVGEPICQARFSSSSSSRSMAQSASAGTATAAWLSLHRQQQEQQQEHGPVCIMLVQSYNPPTYAAVLGAVAGGTCSFHHCCLFQPAP
jgi:hypothetical protein